MIENACSFSAKEIATRLNSDLDSGLDRNTYQKHLDEYGLNKVQQKDSKSHWQILTAQLLDPIIYILTLAAVMAFLFSDWYEGVAILVVIIISVAIGFFMELQAVRSLKTLQKMAQTMTRVLRSGKIQKIKASELVPGDILLIQTGDIVTADARLILSENLTIKESSLTGESVSVTKTTEKLPADTLVGDQHNMVFKGTMVTTGSGRAIVTHTGINTQLGKLQQLGEETEKEITPLEKKLNQLSKWLLWLTLVFTVLIILTGYIRGKDLMQMIETGVALAVAAIPEGLPIVATIALAQGMLRLSKQQVIIKKLEAVQTLGATNIICTDKTGTLTEDKIQVHTVVLANTVLSNVTLMNKDGFELAKKNEAFDNMVLASILCNNAQIFDDGLPVDSIEKALIDFAWHAGYDVASIRDKNPERVELPFDAERKMMATAHLTGQVFYVYAKGAFEIMVESCDSILEGSLVKDFEYKQEWYKKMDELASQGLRTLAFAYKQSAHLPEKENLTQQLVFLGIIGFIDPARSDVKATIDIYKKAGIKVIMATGDHPRTAQKIAEEVGLLSLDAPSSKVLLGKDLDNIENDDPKFRRSLLNASVFGRVAPEQKLKLVTFLQKNGNIVGMIGDGINDVPALRKADVGIAMGIRGTEAAREVSDVILQNDRFTAIELAIRQGRVIFQNIRQFVIYLLSCNLAELLSVGIAALMNLPAPLLPLQILFLNLVTDVFPALALGLGKGELDSMEQPPRDPKEPIMTRSNWYATSIYGLSISASVLGIVVLADQVLELPWDIINNMGFYTLVLAQLFNVFNMPLGRESFFRNEVTQNTWVWGAIFLSLLITLGAIVIDPVAQALSLFPLSIAQFGLIVVFALASLLMVQLVKRLRNDL